MSRSSLRQRSKQYVRAAMGNAKRYGSSPMGQGGGGRENAMNAITNNGLQAHAEQYNHNRGYVYAIIRTIAQRIAGQKIIVGRTNGHHEKRSITQHKAISDLQPRVIKSGFDANDFTILRSHRLIDVLRRPNQIMVGYTLLYVTVSSLDITGKSFWWMQKAENTKSGRDEIWPLPASWVEPLHEQGLFSAWRIRPYCGMDYYDVPGNEIAYYYYPDPSDPMSALAPMMSQARTVTADEYLELAQTRSYQNGINIGMALTVGRLPETAGITGDARPVLTASQRNELINLIKAQYRGVMNQDEPLILDGLITDAKKITNNPREMDYLNSSTNTKSRMAQGWGVNQISMGQIEGANRASSAVADDHLCFPAGTLVLTSNGAKGIETINVGDKVLNSEGQFGTVANTLCNTYEGDLAVIHIGGVVREASATLDHPFWIKRDGIASFIKAGDIRRGDCVGFPVEDQSSKPTARYHWFPVEAVERMRFSGQVYNLEMDVIHDYVTEFGIVSNCSNVCNPRVEFICQTMSYHVAPFYAQAGESLIAYVEKCTSHDDEHELNVETNMVDRGSLSVNEWRKKRGLPPIRFSDGKDRLILLSGAMVPIEIDYDEAKEPDPTDIDNDGIRAVESWKQLRADGMKSVAEVIGPEGMAKLWEKQQRQYEKQLANDFANYFVRLGCEVRRHMSATVQGEHPISSTLADMLIHESEILPDLKDAVKDRLHEIALGGAALEWQMQQPRKSFEIETKGISDWITALPAKVKDNVSRYIDRLMERPFWARIVETIRDKLRGAIKRQNDQGNTGVIAAENAVSDVLGIEAADEHSANIAVTESVTAMNGGQQEVVIIYNQAGVTQKRQWWTMQDAKVRPDHKAAHGQIRGATEPFLVGGESCMYPGDPMLSPKQRCNCRCTVVNLVE